jgi:precorrin-6A/cobalt-precorrin-6A reductase
MTRILILGGTREAVDLAQRLQNRRGLQVVSSLAGRTRTPHLPPGEVRVGGFGGAGGLRDYLRRERIGLLIDATHPFAERMRDNAIQASRESGVPLLRVERSAWRQQPGDRWIFADSVEATAGMIPDNGKRAFLTTGVKELAAFRDIKSVWFLVRLVDPPAEPLPLHHYELILGRGPFGAAEEEALMRRHGIDLLISKESGGESTYGKIAAARTLGIPVVMMRRPPPPDGVEIAETTDAAVARIATLCDLGRLSD